MTKDQPPIEGELADQPAQTTRTQIVAHEPPSASPFDAPTAQFAARVAQRGENYQHLVGWLVENMVLGEDLVQVHFVKRDKCQQGGPGPYGNCSPSVCPAHWSPPDLSKRGAEKICGLLGLGTRFLGMEDFRKAALQGVDIKQIIIDCEIYNGKGDSISQGTGAAALAEFYGDMNKAMKAAAKRAHVDAVKRCAGLSGLATEMKRRMQPIDPDEAKRKAEATAARQRYAGDTNRWNTGVTLTHIPFGKNKGKRWAEVDTRALEWYIQNWADKPDCVRAAAAELSKRKSSATSSTRNPPSPDLPPSQQEDFDDDIPY